MSYIKSTVARNPLEITTPSTVPWRERWRPESERTGTDWPSIIAQHFRVCDDLREVLTSFRDACRDADARKARGESPRYIEPERWRTPDLSRREGAATSTVEAFMLGLRERGTKALEEPAVQRRLSELSEDQLHEVCRRLQRLKPEIARAWEPYEITVLLDVWNVCHG